MNDFIVKSPSGNNLLCLGGSPPWGSTPVDATMRPPSPPSPVFCAPCPRVRASSTLPARPLGGPHPIALGMRSSSLGHLAPLRDRNLKDIDRHHFETTFLKMTSRDLPVWFILSQRERDREKVLIDFRHLSIQDRSPPSGTCASPTPPDTPRNRS